MLCAWKGRRGWRRTDGQREFGGQTQGFWAGSAGWDMTVVWWTALARFGKASSPAQIGTYGRTSKQHIRQLCFSSRDDTTIRSFIDAFARLSSSNKQQIPDRPAAMPAAHLKKEYGGWKREAIGPFSAAARARMEEASKSLLCKLNFWKMTPI